MTKVFKDEENGKAKVTLSWTPKKSDLYRFAPVCFTAETNEMSVVLCTCSGYNVCVCAVLAELTAIVSLNMLE